MRATIAFVAIFLGGCNALLGVRGFASEPDDTQDACAGACECTVDTDCADPHAVCDVTNACTCAAGYAGAPCTWSGVVANPELTDMPNTAWQTTTGATIDPVANTNLGDGGEATFSGNACDVSLLQTITMPRASRAEPLVVRYSVRQGPAGNPGNKGGITFEVGDHWIDDNHGDLRSTWTPTRVCLDADAYAPESSRGPGATVTVGISMLGHNGCDELAGMMLDFFDIVPATANECPPVGAIVNGDAEGTDGWTFSGNATYGATSGFAAGVGENASRAVDIHWGTECGYPSATLHPSLPAAATALAFYRVLPGGHTMNVGGGDNLVVVGGGVAHYCLPAAQRGRITAIGFAPASNSGSVDCTVPVGYDTIVDDVALIDDPACAGDIADADFESMSNVVAGAYTAGGGQVALAHDANGAAHGTGALKLSAPAVNDTARWQTRIVLPVGLAHPALQFAYRATGAFVVPGAAPTLDDAWHTGLACLAGRTGREVVATFGYTGATTPGVAYLDDLQLVSSAGCN